MAYSPKDYILPNGLTHALRGAKVLGQPLLLTGEPGTGKTTFAEWALWHMMSQDTHPFYPEVLTFQTKTNSTARDLFYTYDALSHFQAANTGNANQGSEAFIELQALGLAMAISNPNASEIQNRFHTKLPSEPMNSVVLIDEVDKAPRDFTNDILEEINRRYFFLKEQNVTIDQGREREILIIMTSNSEKDLPDAFLRRCTFFHIDFPDPDKLRQIIEKHREGPTSFTNEMMQSLLSFFQKVRKEAIRKPPATAELIGWLKILSLYDYENQNPEEQKEIMRHNLSFLVKTKEDLDKARDLLQEK